ncbi:MAG: hypothetical protein ACRBBP_04810 [Bdellovibrionales bacterium]
MIKDLQKLAKSLEKNWSLEEFPRQATELLKSYSPKESLKAFEAEVEEWLLDSEKLPEQVNLYNVFGEPALTIFNNGKFAVDVYFWRKNDTLIHSHGFRGAFKVLFGKSLHEEFTVKEFNKEEVDIYSSSVERKNIEILESEEVKTILPGNELVHRVLHLDNPTVSLCVRTVNDTDLSQWHHLSTGISYRQRNTENVTVKHMLYLQYRFEESPQAGSVYLSKILDGMSVSEQLNLYEAVFKDEFGLSEEVSLFTVEAMRERFLKFKWFSSYESHYETVSEHLAEYQASRGDLKLLAHGINCGYSIKEVTDLIGEGAAVEALCQELLLEEGLFIDEIRENQEALISRFLVGRESMH